MPAKSPKKPNSRKPGRPKAQKAAAPEKTKKPPAKPRNVAAAYTPGEKITQCRVCGSQDSKVIRVSRRAAPDRCIRRRQCRACELQGKTVTWITVDLETWKASAAGDEKAAFVPRPANPVMRPKPVSPEPPADG